MKEVRFNFMVSGFVIALIVVAMITTGFSTFMLQLQTNYGMTGNNSLMKYDATQALLEDTQKIQNQTKIRGEEGVLDIIGGYFRSGYSAMQTTFHSFDLFNDMLNDAADDLEFLQLFKIKEYLYMIILIGVFVGVGLAILVKRSI